MGAYLNKRLEFDTIDSYVKDIDHCTTLDEIHKLLNIQIKKLGFDFYTYWLRWPSRTRKEPVFLSTYPDKFIQYYVSNDFQSHDLVGRRSLQTALPFQWSQIGKAMPITLMQKHLFDASSAVGMASGGSIPLHGPAHVKATFSVVNDWSLKEFDKLFELHRYELQILASYAHEKIMQLGLGKQVVSLKLTSRETDVLTWCSRGKSYCEIGTILGISENTVKKHMQNIFQSLDVHTVVHAATKAITYGLINP
jgi:DNA-binding CsgD family transcriptional regulator